MVIHLLTRKGRFNGGQVYEIKITASIEWWCLARLKGHELWSRKAGSCKQILKEAQNCFAEAFSI